MNGASYTQSKIYMSKQRDKTKILRKKRHVIILIIASTKKGFQISLHLFYHARNNQTTTNRLYKMFQSIYIIDGFSYNVLFLLFAVYSFSSSSASHVICRSLMCFMLPILFIYLFIISRNMTKKEEEKIYNIQLLFFSLMILGSYCRTIVVHRCLYYMTVLNCK